MSKILAFIYMAFSNAKRLKTTISGLMLAIPALIYGFNTKDWNEYVLSAVSTGLVSIFLPDFFTQAERKQAKDDFKAVKRGQLPG